MNKCLINLFMSSLLFVNLYCQGIISSFAQEEEGLEFRVWSLKREIEREESALSKIRNKYASILEEKQRLKDYLLEKKRQIQEKEHIEHIEKEKKEEWYLIREAKKAKRKKDKVDKLLNKIEKRLIERKPLKQKK